MTRRRAKPLPEHDAVTAALLFAVDPHALGGVILRGYVVPGRPHPLLAPDRSPAWRAPCTSNHG